MQNIAKVLEVIKLLLSLGDDAAELFLSVWRTVTGPDSAAKAEFMSLLDRPTREAVVRIMANPELAQLNDDLDKALTGFG